MNSNNIGMFGLLNDIFKNRQIINNLVDISVHLVVAAAGACAIYLNSGSLLYASLFVAGGILIDLDHLVDYFIYFKKGFDPKIFFGNHYLLSGKVYIFLHSWEVVFSIFILGFLLGSYSVLALASGLAIHVATDSIMRRNALMYFLTFRLAKRFDMKLIMRPSRDKI